MSSLTPEEQKQVKAEVQAELSEIIEGIAIHKAAYDYPESKSELQRMANKALTLPRFLSGGLAKATLEFCFEHAVGVKLWNKDAKFTPVQYNGSVHFCSIKGCPRTADLAAELEVYIMR